MPKLEAMEQASKSGPGREPVLAGIRIVVADEHTLPREALREVLLSEEDFRVVGDTGRAEEAVELVVRLRPDVVLLDIDMPHNSPTLVARQLVKASPGSAVIVLSMYEDPPLVREMLRIGVRCYLHKGISRRDLVQTIRGMVGPANRVTLSVSLQTLDLIQMGNAGPLSEREEEVLALVAAAMSNRQIATRLSVTEGTVKRHLRNIFAKLGAVSRIDAVNKHKALAEARPGGTG